MNAIHKNMLNALHLMTWIERDTSPEGILQGEECELYYVCNETLWTLMNFQLSTEKVFEDW